MKFVRLTLLLLVTALALCAEAKVQIINGRKYECKDGMCVLVDEGGSPSAFAGAANPASGASAPAAVPGSVPRIAQGYMPADRFIAFLENREVKPLGDGGLWLTLLLVLLGGLAMNLTPCVLPMIPINLIVIGRSARRGAAYGLGITLAYGLLGVGAAVGGLAFGDIQGGPWFNAVVAAVFVGLALSLFDVWYIDLSRFRRAKGGAVKWGGLFAFGMGAMSAVLAGACVAPVLISVLLLTTDLVAKGHTSAMLLPFVMGAGMALPWPFAGAGLQVLPKPGAWMKWVNRVFGAIVLAFAAHYGMLAIRGWTGANKAYGKVREEVRLQDLADTIAGARRPLLVDCWASWCKNCAVMDDWVMTDAKVKKALEPFEVIHVQAEDIGELRKVRGFETIRGLPAFAIFD